MAKKKKTEKPYNSVEIAFIKQYYTQQTDKELASRLVGRTPESIGGKLAELGIKRTAKMAEKLHGKSPERINEIQVTATQVGSDPGKDIEV